MVTTWRFRLVAAIALLATTAGSVEANEFCRSRTNAASPVYDGLKGTMEIRTDPATVSGVGYAHIVQADTGPYGGNYVAVGTYKGFGPDTCENDYDAGWSGYWDGEVNSIYMCSSFSYDAWTIGSKPTFLIEYKPCPTGVDVGWVLTLAGTDVACVPTGETAARRLNVGLEAAQFDGTDRNLDVKYTLLYRNQTNGSSWLALGSSPEINCDAAYSYQIVSSTSHNFYLAPME